MAHPLTTIGRMENKSPMLDSHSNNSHVDGVSFVTGDPESALPPVKLLFTIFLYDVVWVVLIVMTVIVKVTGWTKCKNLVNYSISSVWDACVYSKQNDKKWFESQKKEDFQSDSDTTVWWW